MGGSVDHRDLSTPGVFVSMSLDGTSAFDQVRSLRDTLSHRADHPPYLARRDTVSPHWCVESPYSSEWSQKAIEWVIRRAHQWHISNNK